MSSFGVGRNSTRARACSLRIKARVPSGRAVASANCAAPYRPMPSPNTALIPKSIFLEKSGTVKLAPPQPPPVRELLNAPSALGVGLGFVGSAAQLTVVGVAGGPGGVVSNAFVPTTAQG